MNKIMSCVCILAGMLLTGMHGGCGKPEEDTLPAPETGTVNDIEGNSYKTVKIGSQWWMAENLRVTKYNNGDAIPEIGNDTYSDDTLKWMNDTLGARCLHPHPLASSNSLYGLLYNWHVVNDSRKIAPAGWHIPSDEEWKELEKYLGMGAAEAEKVNFRGNDEGQKLKEKGADNWKMHEELWAMNESNFSALAGSCRMFNNGKFGYPFDLNVTGFWWTSSSNSGNNEAWYRHLDYKKASIFRHNGSKQYGFSVRCIKD